MVSKGGMVLGRDEAVPKVAPDSVVSQPLTAAVPAAATAAMVALAGKVATWASGLSRCPRGAAGDAKRGHFATAASALPLSGSAGRSRGKV